MMYQSHIVTILFLFFATLAFSQTPEQVQFKTLAKPGMDLRGMCNEAGTVNLSLSPNSQSSNVQYLCWGDSLIINHNGDFDLSGDPNPATPPGIGYAFYDCAPSVGGMTLTDILADPCILDTPPSPSGIWITTGNNPNGNTTFTNNGFLQDFFNGGNPVQVWFAPVTVDDFFTNTYEEATPGSGAGPCVDVNTNAAFSVVYLNEVIASDLIVTQYGLPASGSFTISGGLPEFNGSNYTINIYQLSNPANLGTVTSGPASHGSTVEFTVPNDREYVIEITDNTGCGTSFTVFIPSVVFDVECIDATEDGIACVNVYAKNFTNIEGFQMWFSWDSTVVQYLSLSSPGLPNFSPASNSNLVNGQLLGLSYLHPFLGGTSVDSNALIFTLCFTVVGEPGECSPISIVNGPAGLRLEAIIGLPGNDDAQIGISSIPGCVCIVESGDLSGTLQATPLSCPGANDGQLQINVSGGTAPYNYNWAHSSNMTYQGNGTLAFSPSSITIPGLIPGIYSVTITDSSVPQNVVVRQTQILAPPPLTIDFITENPTCFGDTDGSILAVISGGTGEYLFDWSNLPPTVGLDIITDLPSGNYGLTVSDENGCEISGNINLLTELLTISIVSQQNVSCDGGGNNGAITVAANGGTPEPGNQYIYTWSNNANGSSISGLGAGTFTVTATDANGCTATLDVTLTSAEAPVIVDLMITDAGCLDKANGSITAIVTPAPGAPNLTYSWAGPNGTTFTGATISGLLTGNYSLTVTDDNGCSAVSTGFVFYVQPLTITNVFLDEPSCFGGNDGSIGLLVNSGTPDYTFTWSDNGTPTTNSVRSNLSAGTYIVSITDAEGCGPLVDTITLLDPPTIVATLSNLVPVSCNQGICDGQATATALYSDGTSGNFNFTWASGETGIQVTSHTATQLCAGSQTLTIADGSCFIDTTFTMASPPPVEVTGTVTSVSCNGNNDGEITLDVQGGVPGFSYVWAAGDTTFQNTRSNLSPGAYTVTVIDQNGCIGVSSAINVIEPDPFTISLDAGQTQNTRCANEINGRITVQSMGGNAGMVTYQWSGSGSITNTAGNLAPGNYSVTATDSRGCTASLAHTISAPPAMFVTIDPIAEPPCFGESTLVQIANVTGGNGPAYTFSVDNGSPLPITTSIPAFASSTVTISVFDVLGCRWDTLVNIDQPDLIFLDLGEDLELELGDSVNLGPINDLSGYNITTFVWTPTTGLDCANCSQVTAQPGSTTTYTLYIENDNGCSAEDEITIDVRTLRRVYIPNAISPNFDGFNDQFTVFTGKGVRSVDLIQIYDRWGNQIYELADIIPSFDGSVLGWDGTYRGQLMDAGVYVYTVQVTFVDGKQLLYKGDINIIR